MYIYFDEIKESEMHVASWIFSMADSHYNLTMRQENYGGGWPKDMIGNIMGRRR